MTELKAQAAQQQQQQLSSSSSSSTLKKITIPVNDKVEITEIRPDNNDASALVKYLNETKEIYDRTLTIPYPYKLGHAEYFFTLVAHEVETYGQPHTLAIRDIASQELIGIIGLQDLDLSSQTNSSLIGYWVAKSYWGGGIMTQVVKEFLVHVKKQWPDLQHIKAWTNKTNIGSARVLEKNGFVEQSHIKSEPILKDGVLKETRTFLLKLVDDDDDDDAPSSTAATTEQEESTTQQQLATNTKISIPVNDTVEITEIRDTDATTFVKHLNETKQIYDQTLHIPYPYRQEDAQLFINFVKESAAKQQDGHPIHYAIRNTSTQELMGVIDLQELHMPEVGTTQIGYWLAKPYWGQGIMTLVVKEFLKYAIAKWNFNIIKAPVFAFNKGSARVLEKNGFVAAETSPPVEKKGIGMIETKTLIYKV